MSDPLNGFPADQGFEAVFQAGVGIEQVGGVAAAEWLDDEHALLRIHGHPHGDLAIVIVEFLQGRRQRHGRAGQFRPVIVGVVFPLPTDGHLNQHGRDWRQNK